ncbi:MULTISPECIES: ABC transporter substrate-binding protein [Pseudofrankia]|uniref:ABC transporter substrate-binding protein n=1 Tax=Pseudofrankia TaxID=2994363 RepID=UPI000234D5A1|nr:MULTISPECIES: ABC transporter substrate-binding protein [Pseudofrankia]OHV31903.1 sugar transporter [Pseudofrankia sp. EUN1h]
MASRPIASTWITTRGRRLGALTASTLLVAATVAACGGGGGGSGTADDPTTITLTHGYTDAESKALTSLVGEWNTEHPTTKVKLEFNGGNDNALQKTVAGFTAGNYPDVAYQFGSSAAQLARQPKLVDLTSTVAAPAFGWDDFYPSEREATTVDGRVVGIPALVDNLSLVYNKKLFEQAGVAPPTDSWTWEDFRAAAKKLTDPASKSYGWSYVNDGSEDTVWRYLPLLWQAGGDLLTEDNKAPAFDSAAGLAALQQLRDMVVTDKSVYLDTGNQNYLNLFNSGKIAMLWTGPWDLSSITSDVDYGVSILPGYQGNHETISGPDIYMVFDHSGPRHQVALDFITWLTSAKVHLKFAIATGDLPLRKSETQLPEYQTFLQKYPGEKVFVDNLDNVEHVRPNIPSYAEVSTAVGQMVQSVLLGQAEPQAALDSAKGQVASALSRHS